MPVIVLVTGAYVGANPTVKGPCHVLFGSNRIIGATSYAAQ